MTSISSTLYLTWTYTDGVGAWTASSTQSGAPTPIANWTIPAGGVTSSLYFRYSGDSSAPDKMYCALHRSGASPDAAVVLPKGAGAYEEVRDYVLDQALELRVGTLLIDDPKIQVTQSDGGVQKHYTYFRPTLVAAQPSQSYWRYSTNTTGTAPSDAEYRDYDGEIVLFGVDSTNWTFIQADALPTSAGQLVITYRGSGASNWVVVTSCEVGTGSYADMYTKPAGEYGINLYDKISTTTVPVASG